MKGKIRVLVLVFSVFFFTTAAYPGDIKPGFRIWGGLTLARSEGLPTPVGIPETNYKNAFRAGLGLGAGLELKVSGMPLTVILDLGYLGKGTSLDVYYLDTKVGSLPYRLGTLSQIGMIKAGLTDRKLAPYFLVGYELGFVLRHRGTPFGLDGPDLKPDTKKTDFCLLAGAGLELRLETASPFVEFRYGHGLVNLSRNTGSLEYYPDLKSRTLLFSAGMRFGKK